LWEGKIFIMLRCMNLMNVRILFFVCVFGRIPFQEPLAPFPHFPLVSPLLSFGFLQGVNDC